MYCIQFWPLLYQKDGKARESPEKGHKDGQRAVKLDT